MKRIFCLLLALLLVCGLCACGKDAPNDNKPDKGGDTTAATTTATTAGDVTTTTTAGEGTTTSATEGDTTTGNPSATAGTKAPTASATKKPTTTAGGEEEKTIKILTIGGTEARDSVWNHLQEVFESVGYKVHVGQLLVFDKDLAFHCDAIKKDSAVYSYWYTDPRAQWAGKDNVSPVYTLKLEDWDYVIIQQSAAKAGLPESYAKRGELTELIRKYCDDSQIYWNMTWAFRRQSKQDGFDKYSYNERLMYETVVATTIKQVMQDNHITGIIPTGTTIQNLRTSALRDELTSDGLRLTSGYGSYAAALTWYCALTGESADTVTYRPDKIKGHFAELAEAADNAINAPNVVTPTAAGGGEYKDLRILSIGHSFSLDAMRTYMWDLFDAAGYNVTIGYLYYPSCNLEQHWHYINEGRAAYEQYGKNKSGEWEVQQNVDALTALYDEDWDIVTFQPDPDYGHDVRYACQWGCNKTIDSDYVHFNQLVDKVQSLLASADNPHGPNTDVKFYYHLTWTWRADCYLYNYSGGHDQLSLYQAFIDATNKNILPNKKILGVIPCNTTIQNARTTWMGDTFNAEGSNDGYHLNDKGDLAAALTWVSYFTGVKAADIHYKTSYTDAEYAAIQEAVDNAIKNPQKVTQSKYTTQP